MVPGGQRCLFEGIGLEKLAQYSSDTAAQKAMLLL